MSNRHLARTRSRAFFRVFPPGARVDSTPVSPGARGLFGPFPRVARVALDGSLTWRPCGATRGPAHVAHVGRVTDACAPHVGRLTCTLGSPGILLYQETLQDGPFLPLCAVPRGVGRPVPVAHSHGRSSRAAFQHTTSSCSVSAQMSRHHPSKTKPTGHLKAQMLPTSMVC